MLKVITETDLLTHIKEFLAETGMKPTPFGTAAANDPNLVWRLEHGRSLKLKKAGQVADFINRHRADSRSK